MSVVYDPQVYGADDAWLYHPWATFYLTAASFKLFGISTLIARLPYAALGLLAVGLTYALARQVAARIGVARWAAVSLVACVPFFLFMRQCRYYAPSAALGLAWLLCYRRWIVGYPRSALWLVVMGALLFHTNHGVALPFGAAAALDWWIGYRRTMGWRRPLVVAL